MFTAEDGAWKLIDSATKKYEEHFGKDFPIYEYMDVTQNDDFDFSVEGSKRLEKFINRRIEANKPVQIPKGYEDRVY